jgi:hypothetical protein
MWSSVRPLVPVSLVHCCTYTSGLSTWSSSRGLSGQRPYETSSWSGLHAYMLSAFILSVHSYPAVPLARQLEHQRNVLLNPLVLKKNLLKFRTPTADRDRPVSRRSEPSSRTTFIGEQPNPWELLHPQDVMSRHRGAKPLRRYGRSEAISLLSPEYLLSDERWPFHTEPPDH